MQGEVQLDVAARDGASVRVVHGKSHLVNGRSAVVLRHRSPSVAECVRPVLFFLGDAQTPANLLDAVVHTCTERVVVAKPLVETEQVRVVRLCQVFLHQRLYHRLNPHFDVRIIGARLFRLGSVVAQALFR